LLLGLLIVRTNKYNVYLFEQISNNPLSAWTLVWWSLSASHLLLQKSIHWTYATHANQKSTGHWTCQSNMKKTKQLIICGPVSLPSRCVGTSSNQVVVSQHLIAVDLGCCHVWKWSSFMIFVIFLKELGGNFFELVRSNFFIIICLNLREFE